MRRPLLSSMKALLLAAGHGRRAGGPKAFLPHQGVTLLEMQISFLLAARPARDIFVSIQQDWQARCAAINPDVRWIASQPDRPAFASLLLLLKASAGAGWASVHHVDMPVWEPRVFEVLERRSRGSSAQAIVACFEGRRGHPVLLSPTAQDELTRCDPSRDRLDEWLQTRPVEEVEVPFPCVRENWNQGPH